MRRFLVETVLGAVILVTVVLVLSLISVPQPFPFGTTWAPIFVPGGIGVVGYLVAGVVLAIVNRFVRPFIVALTGRFLLSTLGLFVVVINAIMLWVGSLFAPGPRDVAKPVILWVIVRRPSTRSCSTRSPAPLLGLNRPHLQAAEGNRDLWRLLESLPTPRRNVIIENLRLQQVYDDDLRDRARLAAGQDAARRRSGVVLAEGVLGEEEPESATGAEQLRHALPAARADVREDRPDDGRAAPTCCRRTSIAELSKLQSEAAARSPGRRPGQIVTKASSASRPRSCSPRSRRAVRGRVDRPGPPGHARRRHARRRQGPATPDRRQDEGRPRGHVRSSPRIAERRIALARKVGATGRWSTSSPPACSRSSTTATRRTTPSGSPTRWPASRRSTSRSSTTTCPASGS